MKIFCVTGFLAADLDMVADVLSSAGVQQPKPSQQHDALTLAVWHENVLAAADAAPAVTQAVHQPGKFWEQVASTLFLENMRVPTWGWADSRSVWLLDFWQQFEPNLHFVLVYTSPQRALAAALSSGLKQDEDIAFLMASWQAHHQEMLRFYHRNPQRTLLVDADECCANPAALIDLCASKWNIALAVPAADMEVAKQSAPLLAYLSNQLRQTQPHVQSLKNEIEASLHPLGSGAPPTEAAASARNLIDAVHEYQALRAVANEASGLHAKCATFTARIDALDGELIEHKELAIAKQAECRALASAEVSQRNENSLLLEQLHHVQEELEHLFVSSKSAAAANAAKEKATAAEMLAQKNELAAKEKAIAAQILTHKNELAAKNEAIAAQILTHKNELAAKEKAIAAQILTHKNELGALKVQHQADVKKAENSAAVAATTQELARAKQRCSDLEKAQQEQTAKLKLQQGELDLAQKESELLLVQLHQVQEELENYFLQHKDASKQNRALDERWQRMLQRNPDYCDFQALEVLSTDKAGQCASWRLVNLNAAGRSFPDFNFDTQIENGIARITLKRDGVGNAGSALLRWPHSDAQQKQACITTPDVLSQLSAGDWAFLKTLCRVLRDELTSKVGTGPGLLDADDRAALASAIDALTATMDQMPAVMRFDQLVLKREQINPDYEHLWVALQNLSLGDEHWPAVEFRLSCANVRPNKFGAHPKLEFPAGPGEALFDSWFEESYDDFGEKFELRFALPESMDMSVWQALSEHDHATLTSLIAIIPAILAQLEQAGNKLARPWTDWSEMAKNMQLIINRRTRALPAPKAVPTAVVPIAANAIKPATTRQARATK